MKLKFEVEIETHIDDNPADIKRELLALKEAVERFRLVLAGESNEI